MGLDVAIPDTALRDCSDLREKTIRIGRMGRAFAIFRVECVFVYTTGLLPTNQKHDSALLLKLLRFMDTPQYLRRRVFPHSPTLKFAGLLPPLRTRSHPLSADPSDLAVGTVRWGAQAKPGKVDLGLKELADYPHRLQGKKPALFQVVKTTPRLRLEVVEREEIEEYYGFEAEKVDSLVTLLKDSVGVTRIALSRHAPPYNKLEGEIKSTVAGTKSLLTIFGGPRHGVSELLSKEKGPLKEHIDFWVNTVPQQGTETVRLEEAILTSLTLLNNAVGNLVAKPGYHQ